MRSSVASGMAEAQPQSQEAMSDQTDGVADNSRLNGLDGGAVANQGEGVTQPEETEPTPSVAESKSIVVIANGRPVLLDKKENHVFVDIFDYIDFDLSQSRGRGIVTQINGVDAQYTQDLRDGDRVDIYWKES